MKECLAKVMGVEEDQISIKLQPQRSWAYRKNGRNLGLRYSIDSKSLMRVKISLIFDEISNNSLIYIKKSQK